MAFFVIPAYNEEANVPRLLADLESRPDLWRDGGRVILVDDGSSDRTVEVARAHTGELPVEVLVAERNGGPGKAFDRGFHHALSLCGGDEMIVTLESDTTSDLDAVEAMIAAADAGADVVLASHHGTGELANVSAHRRFLSRAASSVIRRGGGLDASTVSSFFRVYRASVLERGYAADDRRRGGGLDASTVSSFFRVYRASVLERGYAAYGEGFIRERGFACKAEILMNLARLGITIAEVPVTLDWSKREGESKMKVIPTMGGYARLMARHTFARARS